jgi:hypothetical protein
MNADTQIVDAEVVEHVDPEPVSGTQLVRRERRSEVLRPLDAGMLVDSFREYQELLPRLLESSDYQNAGGGKQFVKKSGWRKIATAFDLDVILVGDEVDRDETGRAIRAKVIARAIAPSGRTMDGDGYCAITESRFTSTRADLSKVENDLRATATTRAKNRAIADLVGMGDVSAEEIGDTAAHNALPYGPEVIAAVRPSAAQACVKIAGNPDQGIALWKVIARELGYMPQAAAVALIAAANTSNLVPDVEAPDPS